MRSFAFLFVAIAACSSQPSVDDSDALDAPIGKADAASRPSGTYQNPSPHVGEFTTLTLNADYSFSYYRLGACAGGGTCAPVLTTGRYLFTHGTTNRYIRFYDEDGNFVVRFQWKLGRGTVHLTVSGANSWFTMDQVNACEQAGGTCVPLVPDSCANGTIGDANRYSCGGGDGVECCLPPGHDNTCATAADCSGFLPDFCRVCSDNTESCAHWACVESSCQIVTCQ